MKNLQSAVPDRYPGYPDHNRLEAVYDMDIEGSRNMATVIFPYNTANAKADFQKISGEGFNGCSISQGSVVDFVYESTPNSSIQSNEMNYRGDFCLTRNAENSTVFYMVKNGHLFSANNVGFQSDSPLTVYARGNEGVIISAGSATAILYGPGIENVQFEPALQILGSGSDFINIQLSEGTYNFN